ncbi:hypothetical protein [Chitinophaga sp. CF418]|uniref:hypothetical protein n=1 Tax=Chitinophaga sp. CF418 TaxID=1855287 RepID=UPI0009172531|nr:hypothetical protein [Chitinophaga sp. CF418]SHN24829.1 hypothetical protein SAMN05216311_107283 [Chitinophaga sp. CF418]
MKLVIIPLLCLIMLFLADQHEFGNPCYDFADSIIARNNRAPDAAEMNLSALSVAGYYHESMVYEDSIITPKAPVRITLHNKHVLDARELILSEAAKHRIILINEAHYRPQHRLFTKSLLGALYQRGYNVFLAEGILPNNQLDKRAYPVKGEGPFLNEPTYASLIRYAAKKGYKVRAYEYIVRPIWDDSVMLDKNGSMKYISYQPRDSAMIIKNEKGEVIQSAFTSLREQQQAKNILAIIRANPKSRFIIHAGYAHINESGPMMGSQLRQLLNYEDILTIDQTELNEKQIVIDTLTNDTIRRAEAFVLVDNTTKWTWNYYGNYYPVDYPIFNASFKDSLGRPGFLFKDVEKRVVTWLKPALMKDCGCVFSAYNPGELKNEHENAIATDVVYVDNGHVRPLLLYKGMHTIVKKNARGEYTQFSLEVK